MDFDENRLYFSHQNLQRSNAANNNDEGPQDEEQDPDENNVDLEAVRRHFREFLSE